MTQNINRRLDRLEEELKCIMECRRADRVLEILREKQNPCFCPCSTSPSRATKLNCRLAICRSKSMHGPSRKCSKMPVLPCRPHCQPSKRNLLYGKNGTLKAFNNKSKIFRSKSRKSSASMFDDIEVLHEYKLKKKATSKVPLSASKPAKNGFVKREEANTIDAKLCNPAHCAEIENVTKELKSELEIMKTQIMHLEGSNNVHNRITKSKAKYVTNRAREISGPTNLQRQSIIEENSRNTDTPRSSDSSGIITTENSNKSRKSNENLAANKKEKKAGDKETLNASLKEKENIIQSLSDTNNNLLKFIGEKDNEVKILQDTLKSQQHTCECLTQALMELKETIKMKECKCNHLEESLIEKEITNQTLNKSVETLKSDLKQKNKHLQRVSSAIENEVKDLQLKQSELLKQLNECTFQNINYQQEIQRLQGLLTNAQHPDIDLQNKLCEVCCREQQHIKQICMLQNRIQELENVNMNIRRSSDMELDNLMSHNTALQQKYDELARKLEQYEKEEAQRNECVETELNLLQRTMSESEKTLMHEKEELRDLVEELTNIIKDQKTKIQELSDFNRHQEELVKTQNAVIMAKDEQIEKNMSEGCVLKCQIDNWKKKCEFLEQQVQALQNAPPNEVVRESDHTECNEKITELVNELRDAKTHIDELNDVILLKAQIVDDQANTILLLKGKINDNAEQLNSNEEELQNAGMEIKKLTEDLCKLRSELTREKHEKMALENDISELQWHREQLNNKLLNLEAAVKENKINQTIIEENQETIEILQDLLKAQKQEFKDIEKRLTTEKNCAVHAAKYATKKLMETVQDFQCQVRNHQKVQNVLTNLLHEKDDKIRTVVQQMSTMSLHLSSDVPKKSSESSTTEYECYCEPESSGANGFTTPVSMETTTPKQSKKQLAPLSTKNLDALEQRNPGVRAHQSSSLLATGYLDVDCICLENAKKRYESYANVICRANQQENKDAKPKYTGHYSNDEPPAVTQDISNTPDENPFLGILGSQSEVHEPEIVKSKAQTGPRRNRYWPPASDSSEEIQKAKAYTTDKPPKRQRPSKEYSNEPAQEEVITKKVINPAPKRNMYWPPESSKEVEDPEQPTFDTLEEVQEVFQKQTYKPPARKGKYSPNQENL